MSSKANPPDPRQCIPLKRAQKKTTLKRAATNFDQIQKQTIAYLVNNIIVLKVTTIIIFKTDKPLHGTKKEMANHSWQEHNKFVLCNCNMPKTQG